MLFNLYICFSKNNVHFLILCAKTQKTLLKLSLGSAKVNKPASFTKLGFIVTTLSTFLIKNNGVVKLLFVGFNQSKTLIIKNLIGANVSIIEIYHVSTKPFNGCRKKKARRL